MFRRAKLMLADIHPELLQRAQPDGVLVARLGLTDARGNPRCAGVEPAEVQWSVE